MKRKLSKLFPLVTVILLFAAPAQGQSHDSKVLDYMKQTAQVMGMTVEKMGAGARSQIQGQWYLEGLYDKNCIGGFFYEFHPDGTAVNKLGNLASYVINEMSIEIKDRFTPIAIYKLGGEFYIPSFECTLAKLIRGPATKIQGDEGNKPFEAFSCKTDDDCFPTKEGGCMIKELKKAMPEALSHDVKNAKRCRCLKGPTTYGCVPRGSEWDTK